ncbi:MAG: hypothetical protein JWL62_908 [Hyphomicrobiales bacterium]|nr:hypothetical protein [Hyphomicrobiales bacterium]
MSPTSWTPAALLADLLACLRFYSRLPVPVLAFEREPFAMLDFRRATRMLPMAGALLGALGGLALWLASRAGLSPLPASALAIAALLLATGCFHEDGLADTADGFGGGASIARKLEIMKDSRIGTYGGAALVLSLLLRVILLAELVGIFGVPATVTIMVCAAAASRAVALMPLTLLPAARTDGAAFAAAKPSSSALVMAGCVSILLAAVPLAAGVPTSRLGLGLLAMLVAAALMTEISRRQIGGQTGDVAGAAQQLAEIAFLCVLASHAAL